MVHHFYCVALLTELIVCSSVLRQHKIMWSVPKNTLSIYGEYNYYKTVPLRKT